MVKEQGPLQPPLFVHLERQVVPGAFCKGHCPFFRSLARSCYLGRINAIWRAAAMCQRLFSLNVRKDRSDFKETSVHRVDSLDSYGVCGR